MGALATLLADEKRRRALRDAAVALLESEVSAKTGVSGMAVRGVWGLVKATRPGLAADVLDGLLPRFAEALDPLLEQRPAGSSAGAWLRRHEQQVAQALLAVTDERARLTPHTGLASAYGKLRPQAERQVAAAVPRLVPIIESHLSAAEGAAVLTP